MQSGFPSFFSKVSQLSGRGLVTDHHRVFSEAERAYHIWSSVQGIQAQWVQGRLTPGEALAALMAQGRDEATAHKILESWGQPFVAQSAVLSKGWSKETKGLMADLRRKYYAGEVDRQIAMEALQYMGDLSESTAGQVINKWEDLGPGFEGQAEGFEGLGEQPVVLRPNQKHREKKRAKEAEDVRLRAIQEREEAAQADLFASTYPIMSSRVPFDPGQLESDPELANRLNVRLGDGFSFLDPGNPNTTLADYLRGKDAIEDVVVELSTASGSVVGAIIYHQEGALISNIKAFSLPVPGSGTFRQDLWDFLVGKAKSFNLMWQADVAHPYYNVYSAVAERYGGKVQVQEDNPIATFRIPMGGVPPDAKGFGDVFRSEAFRSKKNLEGSVPPATFSGVGYAPVHKAEYPSFGDYHPPVRAVGASVPPGGKSQRPRQTSPSRYEIACHFASPLVRPLIASRLSGKIDDTLMAAYRSGLGGGTPDPNLSAVGPKGAVTLNFDIGNTSGHRTTVDLGGNLETGYVVNSIADDLGIFPEGTEGGDFIEASVVQDILRRQGLQDNPDSNDGFVNSSLGPSQGFATASLTVASDGPPNANNPPSGRAARGANGVPINAVKRYSGATPTINDLANLVNCVQGDIHLIQFYASGNGQPGWDELHNMAGDYYEQLGKDYDDLCKLSLQRGEDVTHPNLSARAINYQGCFCGRGAGFPYGEALSSFHTLIMEILDYANDLKWFWAGNGAISATALTAYLDDFILRWSKEAEYKLERRLHHPQPSQGASLAVTGSNEVSPVEIPGLPFGEVMVGALPTGEKSAGFRGCVSGDLTVVSSNTGSLGKSAILSMAALPAIALAKALYPKVILFTKRVSILLKGLHEKARDPVNRRRLLDLFERVGVQHTGASFQENPTGLRWACNVIQDGLNESSDTLVSFEFVVEDYNPKNAYFRCSIGGRVIMGIPVDADSLTNALAKQLASNIGGYYVAEP